MERHVGRIVLGFRIEAPLGEGSFGIVYLARHVELGREVAIKILRPEHARDQAAVARFLREAKLVCQLSHPAIVEVENVGMLDDEPYYVMEFIAGRSLARRLAEDGPLRVGEVASVFGPLASALDLAHSKGVIHRDLKPHNIMITEAGGAITGTKLFDFGIAKLLEVRDSGSQTGGLMGTPHFMAPEQARDAKNVDVRADVYGYAATLYAAASGRRPFEGDSLTEVLVSVQMDTVPPLSTWLPEATPALDALIARCLAKEPEKRPGSVGEAAKGILAELAAIPPDARSSRSPRRRSDAMATVESGPTEEPPRVLANAATLDAASGAAAPPASPSESLRGSIDPSGPTRHPARRRTLALVAAGVIAAAAVTVIAVRRRAEDRGASTSSATADAGDARDVRVASAPSTPEAAPDAAPAAPAAVTDAASIASVPAEVPAIPDAALPGEAPHGVAAHDPSHGPAHRPHLPPHAPATGPSSTPPPIAPPDAAPAPPPTPQLPPPPAPPAPPAVANCARTDFAAVYDAASADVSVVRAALRHLRECRTAGAISQADYDRYQAALVGKL